MVALLLTFTMVVYIWPVPAMRIVLGVPYVLFLPGYALTMALFPRRHDLDSIARTALSFGLDIAILTFIGLVLHYTGWGIHRDPILISVNTCILLCCGVAYYRRSQLPPEDRFVIRLEFDLSSWQRAGRTDRWLSVALALSAMAATGSLAYGVVRPKSGEQFTDFYILGPDGVARGYPQDTIAGEPISLIVGIVNREHSSVHYRVEIERDGETEHVANLQLGHEETWEQTCTFKLANPGENRRVTFLLYKGNEQEPCHSLHLWITVREKTPQA